MSKTDPKTDAKKPEQKLVHVRSKGERFRRAGILFTKEGVFLDPATLNADQVEAINSDPSLVVVGGELVATEKKAAK